MRFREILNEDLSDHDFSAGGGFFLPVRARLGNEKRMMALRVANRLESEGADRELIRHRTGWFKNSHGLWREEIGPGRVLPVPVGKTYKLTDVLDHEELYSIIPNLMNYDVYVRDYAFRKSGAPDNNGGFMDFSAKRIEVTAAQNESEDIRRWFKLDDLYEEGVRHEVQHAIQAEAGERIGGDRDWLSKNLRPEVWADQNIVPTQGYERLPWEQEARKTAERFRLSGEDLKSKPVWSDQEHNESLSFKKLKKLHYDKKWKDYFRYQAVPGYGSSVDPFLGESKTLQSKDKN